MKLVEQINVYQLFVIPSLALKPCCGTLISQARSRGREHHWLTKLHTSTHPTRHNLNVIDLLSRWYLNIDVGTISHSLNLIDADRGRFSDPACYIKVWTAVNRSWVHRLSHGLQCQGAATKPNHTRGHHSLGEIHAIRTRLSLWDMDGHGTIIGLLNHLSSDFFSQLQTCFGEENRPLGMGAM